MINMDSGIHTPSGPRAREAFFVVLFCRKITWWEEEKVSFMIL